MTEKELVQLCKLGESTTVQYKLEFTTQKQIAEEMVALLILVVASLSLVLRIKRAAWWA